METNYDKKFFFISYNHEDPEIGEDLAFFDGNHVNYWIDRDGMSGKDDSWVERAEMTLQKETCAGAVFYLSTASLASSAVEQEIDLVSRKRKVDENFFVIAVLLGGRSIPHLIKRLYDATDDSQLAKTLPLERIRKVAEMFPDGKIYRVRSKEALDQYRAMLMKDLWDAGVVLDLEAIEDELASSGKLDAYSRYSFGTFYGPEAVVGVFLIEQNVFLERNGRRYIKLDDGTVHAAEPIKWIILDYSDGVLKLISESVLEKVPGRDMDEWFNDRFRTLAFTPEEQSRLVGRIGTLTCEEYEAYSKDGDINPTGGSFWLNSINTRGQQNMLMQVRGKKIDGIGYRKDKKYGVRPVISVRIDEILGETQNG